MAGSARVGDGIGATAGVAVLPSQTPCSSRIRSSRSRSRDCDGRAADCRECEICTEAHDGVGIGELEGSSGHGVAGCDGGVEGGGVGYHGAEVGDGDGDVKGRDAVEEVEVGG